MSPVENQILGHEVEKLMDLPDSGYFLFLRISGTFQKTCPAQVSPPQSSDGRGQGGEVRTQESPGTQSVFFPEEAARVVDLPGSHSGRGHSTGFVSQAWSSTGGRDLRCCSPGQPAFVSHTLAVHMP